ncbi:hypothetical protein [Prevotella sp. 10(H)]|uniref:hypothetical protein n=1 Tax=Prevotella sp. 10(H) TaxID=1158294 RepID=UPI0004A74F12|nr:hypothetical protein [Prevotella sp. 10(H)]
MKLYYYLLLLLLLLPAICTDAQSVVNTPVAKYLYPKFDTAIHTITEPDTCTLLIPAQGTDNHFETMIVWVDDTLRYFPTALNTGPYGIRLKGGKHTIRLRATYFEVILTNFEIKENCRTFLYINPQKLFQDGNEDLPNVKFRRMSSQLTKNEKKSLAKELFVMDYDFKYKKSRPVVSYKGKEYNHHFLLLPSGQDSMVITKGEDRKSILPYGGEKYIMKSDKIKILKSSDKQLDYIGPNLLYYQMLYEYDDFVKQIFIPHNKTNTVLRLSYPDIWRYTPVYIILLDKQEREYSNSQIYSPIYGNDIYVSAVPGHDNDEYDVYIFYPGKVFSKHTINIKAGEVNNLTITEATEIIKNDNQISTILNKLSENKAGISISVIDKKTKEPLIGALAEIVGTNNYGICGLDGIARLKINPYIRNQKIKIAFLGYREQYVTYDGQENSFHVELEEADNRLL